MKKLEKTKKSIKPLFSLQKSIEMQKHWTHTWIPLLDFCLFAKHVCCQIEEVEVDDETCVTHFIPFYSHNAKPNWGKDLSLSLIWPSLRYLERERDTDTQIQ